MPNIIDSIQLSGVTYGIKGSGGTETIELTQAQYDALVNKDPNTFYIITDATAGDLTNYYTKTETDDLLDTKLDASAYTPTDLSNYYTKSETSGATQIQTALASKADTATTYTKSEVDNAITAATSTKQNTLVSGTNIKTINNESILGSGNIDIQGGGGISSGDVQTMIDESISGKVDTSAFTAYTASTESRIAEDEEVTAAALNNINDRLSEDEEVTAAGLNALNESLNDINDRLSEDEEVTAAGLNAVNDKFDGLKLKKISQTDYDNLQTKDSNTLYIVI